MNRRGVHRARRAVGACPMDLARTNWAMCRDTVARSLIEVNVSRNVSAVACSFGDAQAGQRRSDSRPAYVYNEGVGHASRSARPAPAHSTPRTQARRKRTPAPHGAEHVRRRARRSTHSRRVWREIGSWVVTLALAALVGFVVRGFVFELVRVEGPSMSPTLASGEVLLVTRLTI